VEYRWAVEMYGEGTSARIDALPAAEVEALVQVQEAHVGQWERERLVRVEKGVFGPAHPFIQLLEDNACDFSPSDAK
jgi:hypothetical protein